MRIEDLLYVATGRQNGTPGALRKGHPSAVSGLRVERFDPARFCDRRFHATIPIS
jgi:hypothetical protein